MTCRPDTQLLWVSLRALLNDDDWRVVDGLHDSCKATAQVVGLADVDFGWVFKNYCISWTIQNPGQKLTQLHLQRLWKQAIKNTAVYLILALVLVRHLFKVFKLNFCL